MPPILSETRRRKGELLGVASYELGRPTAGALLVGLVGCVLFATAPHRDTYWSALPSILAFALAPTVFPQVRLRLETPVCPFNWVLLVFGFQLVIDPLLLCWTGPYINTLPFLPDASAINVAQLIVIISWVGFVIGTELSGKIGLRAPQVLRSIEIPWQQSIEPRRLAIGFVALGVAGLAIAFHTPGALFDYLTHPAGHVGLANTVGQSGAVKSLSLLLRPFLAAALLIPWARWVDERRPHLALRTAAMAVPVAVASATYSYNRAAVIAPLIAMLAVYGARVRRLRFMPVVAITVVVIAAAATARAYRNAGLPISRVLTSTSAAHKVLDNVSLNKEIQIYTSAPQFLAYLVSQTGYGLHPRYGKTLISSVMYPVPLLGKPFRASSDVDVYNHLIYGNNTTRDQIAPFQGELFLDFAYAGVLAGYVLVALLAVAVQRAFERARTAWAAFAWQYVGIWVGFLVVGSIAVVIQISIYFFLPFVVFAVFRKPPRERLEG